MNVVIRGRIQNEKNLNIMLTSIFMPLLGKVVRSKKNFLISGINSFSKMC